MAVLPSIWARGDPMAINVLGTLALGAALCWTLESPAPMAVRVGVCLAAAGASGFVEFGLGGVFLIPAIYLWSIQREPELAVLATVLLLMTGWLNTTLGGQGAMLGTMLTLPIAMAVRALPVHVPRLRVAFYLVYPLHLALIGALKSTA